MMSREEFVPNERLRRVRSLKGWSQAELAEQVGTSFEMVSRWERGVTVPSLYYRERLCAVLGQTAEELGLMRARKGPFTPPPSPLILLASSHEDTEKAIVSHLKTALQERGITLWSSRQLSRQGRENVRMTLREVVQAAQAILVILSPEARSSRHVREALEMASRYQRPVCGVWIEGEHWQECLPKSSVELAVPIDARGRDDSVVLEEIVRAIEGVGFATDDMDMPAPTEPEAQVPTVQPRTPSQGLQAMMPSPRHSFEPTAAATPVLADAPIPPTPIITHHRRGISRSRAVLLIGLLALVIVGGILGSLSLLAHSGVQGPASGPTPSNGVHGGTWIDDYNGADIDSLIPNGSAEIGWLAIMIDQALYLPLFYGDAQGVVHAGAATEVPTLHNGGINADFKTWTFHLKPHLVWSDGQPYDARDVDYSWKTWINPKFGMPTNSLNTITLGLSLISGAEVSADHLTISFHLKQAYAPFLSLWVDGVSAPLPEHHFSAMAPQAILKSPDNLNPKVTSGPFMMGESQPGDHYTLVRNPRYYRASEGLPYLDKVVFRIVADEDTILKDLRAGSIDSAWSLDVTRSEAYQRLTNYTLTATPTSDAFEAMYFNFHNTVLATHPEVRQAMAKAIDRQALIEMARHGFATSLCTDHGSAYHPGYQPDAPCPEYDPATANKLLDDNGWVRGPDGVRTKGGQRLEFEYSIPLGSAYRSDTEVIVQRNFKEIGIKLDIQNYPYSTFFGSFLPEGKASLPSGAVSGRYDIAQFFSSFAYDPDDSFLLACDQFPPNGYNIDFYCNPALDALYRQEQTIADPGVRQRFFEQIHQIYLTDFPFIVLYGLKDIAMVRKGTHNYQPSPIEGGTVNIWEWWCDHGKC